MKIKRVLSFAMSLGLCLSSSPVFASTESVNSTIPQDFNTLYTQDAWPVPNSTRITQQFNQGVHNGIDIGARTPGVAGDGIVAFYEGTVSRSGWSDSYGWVAYIDHTIDNNSWQSRYAHMSKAPVVSTYTDVYTGQYIGNMGNTGQSEGVHLHFETRINGYAVDPIAYFFSEYASAQLTTEIIENQALDENGEWELGNFYSVEEINQMTPKERQEKGIPLE